MTATTLRHGVYSAKWKLTCLAGSFVFCLAGRVSTRAVPAVGAISRIQFGHPRGSANC